MTRNKLSKFLLFATLAAAPVLANADAAKADDPRSSEERAVAVHSQRDDGARVAYYAALTTIAERDIKTAEITLDMSREQWDAAMRAQDKGAAAYWAQRHRLAQVEAREARVRADRNRVERDSARADFEDSAAEVRAQR